MSHISMRVHPQRLKELAGTMPVKDLAEYFCVTERSLRTIASKHRVSLAHTYKMWSPDEDQTLRELRDDGVPILVIAARMNRSKESVLGRIKMHVLVNDWPASTQGMRRAQATHPRVFLTPWIHRRRMKDTEPGVNPDARILADFGSHVRRICSASDVNWSLVRKYRVIKTDY